MGDRTGIEWTDATWNPVTGCTKVSPGCKFCYMYRDQEFHKRDPELIRTTTAATFNGPLRWPDGIDVFSASWSDWFLPAFDADRPRAWEIIRRTPGKRYFILTKRPENIPGRLPDGWPFPNVLLGVSVEAGPYLRRVRLLLNVPAVGYFVSAEPLLGSLFRGAHLDEVGALAHVDWLIIGGESGRPDQAVRALNPAHARTALEFALEHGLEVNFKQWGDYAPGVCYPDRHAPWCGLDVPRKLWAGAGGHLGAAWQEASWRVGKKRAGRELCGRTWDARPRVGMTGRYLLEASGEHGPRGHCARCSTPTSRGVTEANPYGICGKCEVLKAVTVQREPLADVGARLGVDLSWW